ncbi:MAG: DUF2721 domain-containing protein [Novosphingobium sp.]|nr:DUF2721 domain-containing protein [Novosphingobium sp.]
MIAQTIQLALAPVFLLVAIGNLLNLLSTRLGRIVDRSRLLLDRYAQTQGSDHDAVVLEIRSLDKRITLIGRAILLLVMSGLMIGIVVVLLFVEELAELDLHIMAASIFMLAIALMMWALTLFVRETRLASASLRIPQSFLELDRRL